MNTKSTNLKPEITPANFPALRSFLRGYFHEDVADEYGTPVDAADQFCEDAESDERSAVANEWTLLMNVLQGRPLPEINQALTGKLGGAVRLNEEEIQQVSQIFARCLAVKPHRKIAND
jgi:hypothetical protein